MSRKTLGLDIRHDYVSAVLVKNTLKGKWVEYFDIVPVEDYKNIKDNIDVLLNKMGDDVDIKGSDCIASLPPEKVSFRNISVPPLGSKKIRQLLPYEMEATLSMPVENLIIDSQIVKPSNLHNNAGHTDLIAAAVEKEMLGSFLDCLNNHNLSPEIITAGGFPTALYMYGLSGMAMDCLLVDMGTDFSSLFVINSRGVCLARSFKNAHVESSDIYSLCKMIGNTLSAAEDIIREECLPEKVLITGSGSMADGCGEVMAEYLGVPVNNLNLIQNTDIYVDNYSGDMIKSGYFDNALALAAIEIEGTDCLNFRRGSFAAGSLWLKHKTNFIVTGILLTTVLLFMSFNSFIDYYLMNKSIKAMDIQIREIFTSTFPDAKKIKYPVQQMKVKIGETRKKQMIPEDTGKNIRSIDILNEISRVIEKNIDVEFTQLVIGTDSVLINGNTNTFNSVDDIKGSLEKIVLFKSVVISSANTDRSGNRVRFQFNIQL